MFIKKDKIYDFLFASLMNNPSKMTSTIKGKNLLLEEQILSFESGPLFGRPMMKEELLPLKVYPFDLEP